MHLDGRIGNAPRLHPLEAAARLRAGCAQPPFSTPVFLLCHLAATPCVSHSLSLRLRRVTVCSQFVSRVCAHTPYSGTVRRPPFGVNPPCSTLLFAGSGPRENSYVVSSCRVTPSRLRTSRPRNRIVEIISSGDDIQSLTHWRIFVT